MRENLNRNLYNWRGADWIVSLLLLPQMLMEYDRMYRYVSCLVQSHLPMNPIQNTQPTVVLTRDAKGQAVRPKRATGA